MGFISSIIDALVADKQAEDNFNYDIEKMRMQQGYIEKNMGLENEYALGQMERQHELNRSDWEAQNEYNLPQNQYQRYVDSGMSEAAAMQAIAGAGSLASQPASASPGNVSGQAPSGSSQGYADYSRIGRLLIDERLADSEIALKKALTNKADSETDTINSLRQPQVDKLVAETMKNYSDIEKNSSQKDLFVAECNKINLLTPLERDKLVRETNLVVSQVAENLQSIKNLKQQISESQSRESVNYSEAGLNYVKEQGQVYENINKFYEANKKAVTNLVVEKYHLNPQDPYVVQLIEAGSKGEKYAIDLLQALSSFASGVDSEIKKEYPHYKTGLKVGAGLYLFDKLRNKRIDYKIKKGQRTTQVLNNIHQIEDLIPILGALNGNTVVDPLESYNWMDKD